MPIATSRKPILSTLEYAMTFLRLTWLIIVNAATIMLIMPKAISISEILETLEVCEAIEYIRRIP